MSDNDQVFDLRPMKSERINLADRISALEVENAALRAQLNAEQEVSHSALAQVVALTTESNVWAARWSKMCYAYDNEVGRRTRANNHIVTLKNEVAALKDECKRIARNVQEGTRDGFAQTVAELKEQIVALTAERDAEKERYANNHAEWTAANEELRDAHQHALNERDAARQSRARLVRLVRHLRAWFSATAPDSAFVKRITDERDAARAWAAAWRVSAHYWKAQQKFTGYAWAWTDGKIGGDEYFERTDKVRDWMYANVPAFVLERIDKRLSDNLSRAADARRAAEAMERAAETGTVTRIDRVLTVEERKALFDAGKGALEAMERQ